MDAGDPQLIHLIHNQRNNDDRWNMKWNREREAKDLTDVGNTVN